MVEEVKELAEKPIRGVYWLLDELHYLFRVLLSSAERFYWDDGFSKAASLAYTTLLSLVPAMALGFGLLASFAASEEVTEAARSFLLKQFIPDLAAVNTVIEYLTSFSEKISSINVLASAFLVVTTILLLNSIEYVLNETWQVFEPRSIGHRIQIFCALIVVFPVLLLSATYFGRLRIAPILDDLSSVSWIYSTYEFSLPFVIDLAAFTALYYLVPKAPVKLRSAIFGAVLAALLFGAGKGLFAVYIERFSSYGRVYGAVAGIPIFLFWLYLAWTILLFGAECSYQAQYLPRKGTLWKRSVTSTGDANLLLAMQALVMISRAFLAGQRVPNELDIAERLGCSSMILKPALAALERGRIISRGEGRDAPLTLLRSPDRIELQEVRQALFSTRQAVNFSAQMARVFALLSQGGGQGTLADVLNGDMEHKA